ncbi:MAG: outer membrane protein assembly factor BamA, partial [Gemmatimonadetes bacterium]
MTPRRRTFGWIAAAALVAAAAPSAHAQEVEGGPIAAGPVVIDSIRVVGNVRQSELTILGAAGLNPGNAYTIFDLQRAAKDLWRTGQFRDLKMEVQGFVGEGVTLTVRVDEADLMRNVVIRGLEHLDERDVQDTTGLKPGRPFSPGRLAFAQRYIREELADRGIPFARIEYETEPLPGREKEVILRLDVSEGNRITVADVSFEGNEVFSDDELKDAMGVKPEGFWWWSQGKYDRERFDQDLAVNLPALYARNGYIDFQILGDSLVIDPQTGKTRLVIRVDEGPQYRVGDFRIVGNREFSTEELEAYYRREDRGLLAGLGFGGGREDSLPVFDQPEMMEATQRAGERYRNAGYLYSAVIPIVDRRPRENDDDPYLVDVTWQVQENQRAYVHRVDIEGNEYTHDRVIRDRIFVLPGDVFSQDRVLQSYQSISSLGFFEVPLAIPDIQPNETGDVDITFKVQEKATGSMNFGTSVGGGVGLSGFIGYNQPNLFGQGKNVGFRWDFGRFLNNLTLDYTDPAIRESRISGSISLFAARDRFISFRSGRRRRIGGSLRF